MLSGAICYALTAAGLVLAGLHGRHRRWRTATRWAGLALVPAGLYLTGLLSVGTEIGRAIGSWATKLVFDPSVWVGIVLLGVAALLIVLSRIGTGGGEAAADAGGAGRKAGRERKPGKEPVTGQAPAPAIAPKKGKSAAEELGDFSDIEEILRKRGI
ncbi:hypothetical protein [Kitasatospora sp. LaBMicrA B282]|uniref:hypothetical protein n=1 Tax=Kitasatospora sp. LaBMicrA B282 TaxID=3420949 RepID=UPI003D138CF8